jgi:hypothetical protein
MKVVGNFSNSPKRVKNFIIFKIVGIFLVFIIYYIGLYYNFNRFQFTLAFIIFIFIPMISIIFFLVLVGYFNCNNDKY